MGITRNPLRGPDKMQPVEVGKTLLELKPEFHGLLLCKLNGEIISRLTDTQRTHIDLLTKEEFQELAIRADNWAAIRVREGDVIEWHDEPGNREGVRLVLQVAIAAAAAYITQTYGAGYGAAFALVGGTTVSLLTAPRQPKAGQAAEGVFSTTLSGNAARLDEPIPKICGRVKVTPPYAMLPYPRFEPSDLANPDHNRDQYVHVLLVVGVGNHEIEKALIGRTSLTHFQDITTNQYLAPGVPPSVVKANTLISSEIASSELDSKMVGGVFQARYVGGIAGCRPGDTFTNFSIHVGAEQGLGKSDTGGGSSRTAVWQVEEGEIDNFGRPIAPFQIVANEARTDNTNTPQRWTSDYTNAAPIRGEIRLVRTDLKGTSAEIRDGIQWIGMQVELDRGAPLNAETAHYEIVIRSSDQLSAYSQRDFSLIIRGMCRTWEPDTDGGGTWGAEVFTRNAAWWLADLLTSTTWGMGLPDERIDLLSIWEWAQVLDARQDHFDYAFAERMDAWEAAQLIARAGRARVFHRNGLISVARDELVDLPVAAFTPRNTIKGSMAMETRLPGREAPDGILAQYLDLTSWDIQTIECPAPGRRPSGQWSTRVPLSTYSTDLPEMENPIARFYPGITGPTHAEREGLYDAADLTIRTTVGTCTVEMEGAVIAYLDPVRWMPEYPGYGQSGDVAFWDPDTLVMTLTEPPRWEDAPLYLTLRRDDGSLTDPVEVFAGPTANDVVLSEVPDFDLVLDAGNRERAQFLLGNLTRGDEIAKLANRANGGKQDGAQLFDLTFVIDDDRVHEADNHLLPGPGDIQDPIDDGLDYPADIGGGFATIPRLTRHQMLGGQGNAYGGLARITVSTDGQLSGDEANSVELPSFNHFDFVGEWLNTVPVDPAVAALYEVRAVDLLDSAAVIAGGATVTGTFGTWLPVSGDLSWTFEIDDAGAYTGPVTINPNETSASVAFDLQIRRIGVTQILANNQMLLTIVVGIGGGGA